MQRVATYRDRALIEAPDVYAFHDYRAFLKAFIEYRKKTERLFSLRHLAKQCELTVSYLSMVTNQKRSLTAESFRRVGEALQLSREQMGYLDLLRIITDTGDPLERQRALEKITKLKKFQQANPGTTESYKYLTHWYYVAIREMAQLDDFTLDAEWIQKRLRVYVPIADLKEAIDFLLKHDYLSQASDGRYRQTQKSLDCSGELYRLAIGNFHREMLALNSQALEELPIKERFISSHTMAIPASAYGKVVEVLEATLKKLAQDEGSVSEADTVYHITLSAVPLTRHGGKS